MSAHRSLVAPLRELQGLRYGGKFDAQESSQSGLGAKECGRELSQVQWAAHGMTLYGGREKDRQVDCMSWPLGELVLGGLRLVCSDEADRLVLQAFLMRVGRT